MSTLSNTTDFANLKSIALLCTEVDDVWYQSIKDIEDPTQQALAVTQCAHKLEQMSQPLIRCVGVVFENIKLEKEKLGVSSQTRLQVYHKNSSKLRRPSISFAPSDEARARFYVLHERTLLPIILSPDSDKVLIVDAPQNSDSPKLSPKLVGPISQQLWNGCFIAANSFGVEVIPLPTSAT